MDKKSKQRRHKTPTPDELKDVTPRGASFDTEEGRAAQGMRPDIGQGDLAAQGEPESGGDDDDDADPDQQPDAPPRRNDPESPGRAGA
jgi:hypothetical protein